MTGSVHDDVCDAVCHVLCVVLCYVVCDAVYVDSDGVSFGVWWND